MNHRDRWRTVQASVPGVAHQESDIECQDACAVQLAPMTDNQPPGLVLVAADGAGSATRSRDGAEQVCQTLLAECAAWLAQATDEDWQPAAVTPWLQSLQTVLAQQAAEAALPIREFACTLLGAIVAADRALFLQIGDGAIVIGSGHGYQPIFWPQGGQYVNETWFVTDPNAADFLQCVVIVEPVAEIALLTDGLQPLALHYQSHQAHEPFFRPLFQSLRDYPEDGSLAALTNALEQFLDSPAVNQRTHDDKTLILAIRQPMGNINILDETAASPEKEPSASNPLPDSEKDLSEGGLTTTPEFQDDVGDPTL